MKLSFNNPGYITTGFNAEIPMLVQLYMIAEIEALSELDSDKLITVIKKIRVNHSTHITFGNITLDFQQNGFFPIQ